MSDLASLMRRADTLRKTEVDPARQGWWAGYMRGLRRAHHGGSFGTDAEHKIWLGLADDPAPDRAMTGLGYVEGLKFEPAEPPTRPGQGTTGDTPMKTCNQISGDELAQVEIVVDAPFCHGIADTVARELAVLELREQGVAWRQARKQVSDVTGTPEMYRAVEAAFARGADAAALRNVAKDAAKFSVIK